MIIMTFISLAIDFVKEEISKKGIDASHDWNHIHRVWCLAKDIATVEGIDNVQMARVELASILHDVDDHKYKITGQPDNQVEIFLTSLQYDEDNKRKVLDIIDSVSYTKEKLQSKSSELDIEARIVQDADRLDAIGAIGIARCFTYGGARGNTLYDNSDIQSTSTTTLAHFFQVI